MTSRASDVLSLYRSMLRYGKQLKLTDKEFFFRRIREEFDKKRELIEPEKIDFYIRKGQEFLSKKRLL